MGLTKLAAKLPDDTDLNGLDHWIKHLKERPFEQLVIVAFIDTQKLVTDFEKGQVHPVIQIQAVEVIDTAIDCPPHIRLAFDAARDRRTNRAPLFDTQPTPPEHPRSPAELTTGDDVEPIDAEVVDDDDR